VCCSWCKTRFRQDSVWLALAHLTAGELELEFLLRGLAKLDRICGTRVSLHGGVE
jgi:hypothetical protein